MKVLVAPDSYKGSLTAIQAANIIKMAIQDMGQSDEVITLPMADGGDGTLDVLLASMQGEKMELTCTGPLGDPMGTNYAITQSQHAMIEYALVAGLTQVPPKQQNPDITTSKGLGEVMLDALDRGCTSLDIGLGGSATNDGGLGMLLALGMKAWDKNNEPVDVFGKHLNDVIEVDLSNLDHRLKETTITIASDVHNPLSGGNGASAVYGPQKGATPEQVKRYDADFARFGSLIEQALNVPLVDIPGAGAAGGLGFGLLALGGTIVSGTQFVAEELGLEQAIQTADLIITGEGQSDEQTLYGKAPSYIAEQSRKYKKPTLLISGSLAGDMAKLREHYAGCFSIINEPLPLERAIEKADKLLYEQTKHVMHLVNNILRKT